MKAWLASYSWAFVTAQNHALCAAKGALHKPSSDGFLEARNLWEGKHLESMRLSDAVELCRRCHRIAPFCFYNGNTFAAIIRDVIYSMSLPPEEAYVLRSLVGHIVAGVSTGEEEAALAAFSDSLEEE